VLINHGWWYFYGLQVIGGYCLKPITAAMATIGPPGAFRRITVHYSTAGDEANNDGFLEFVTDDVLQDQVYI
jgi:hypothetical protein